MSFRIALAFCFSPNGENGNFFRLFILQRWICPSYLLPKNSCIGCLIPNAAWLGGRPKWEVFRSWGWGAHKWSNAILRWLSYLESRLLRIKSGPRVLSLLHVLALYLLDVMTQHKGPPRTPPVCLEFSRLQNRELNNLLHKLFNLWFCVVTTQNGPEAEL
jgi:hypothetical protein